MEAAGIAIVALIVIGGLAWWNARRSAKGNRGTGGGSKGSGDHAQR